jgi:hypothetical protein
VNLVTSLKFDLFLHSVSLRSQLKRRAVRQQLG